MRRQLGPGQLERAICALALEQHALSHRDLVDLGLSHATIERRLASGRLVPLHRGVYAIGGTPPSPERRWSAAVLAAGPGGVLSHLSAAALWGLRSRDPVVVDVSVLNRSGRRRPGLRVHRPRYLTPEQTTRHRGICVTKVERTLIDCAFLLGYRSLERLLDEAEYLGLLRRAELRDAIARSGRSRGAARLRKTLARHEPGTTRTRSRLEEDFLALVSRSAIPQPLVNSRLGPYTIDFLWERQKVAVETDGRRAHDRTLARERDHARDAWLTAQGYSVLRFTWSQVQYRSTEVLAALEIALAR